MLNHDLSAFINNFNMFKLILTVIKMVPKLMYWIQDMPLIESMMFLVSLIGLVKLEAAWINSSTSTLVIPIARGTKVLIKNC